MGTAEDEASFRWLNEYEKTWEAIQEDDDGLLQSSIDEIVHQAKRKRLLVRKGNVRLGMMRHLYIILDMSKSMKESDLLRPSRLACLTKLLENFIVEYFDQNPISQLGIIATRNKRAEKITDLSGNPNIHIAALQNFVKSGPEGEPSLQNSLDMALQFLGHLPKHASREILIVFGSLTTCDPGDIFTTINNLKNENIRCSVLGLSAEIKLCKTISSETNGIYNVILDEKHCNDLLLEHIRPPAAKLNVEASLVRMGFPQHISNTYPALCLCHIELKNMQGFNCTGYFCPQCKNKYCELPVECKVCGLTLVSAPHLARSYQHLFPLPPFEEVRRIETATNKNSICQGCQRNCIDAIVYICKECKEMFCNDCDMFIHETLHTCPGCTSKQQL
ncbi:general transcription factor IIH subunit 2 isoform X2 [Hydra vulgaris]|uniref:General transcription factor IIH subunit n=1 Tax=Hydra vulgaris TaxID=6087 RepID=A0ABM4C1U2_HYDVU